MCRIFDLGRDETSGVSFLIMEFLPGQTLASRIGAGGIVPPDESLPLVRQMADALDTAHHAGIVHRDFKSANVMLVPSAHGNRAVITDFGLAVSSNLARQSAAMMAPGRASAATLDDATWAPAAGGDMSETTAAPESGTGGMVGTPAYMSPEQVRGDVVGPATDLYALGGPESDLGRKIERLRGSLG